MSEVITEYYKKWLDLHVCDTHKRENNPCATYALIC